MKIIVPNYSILHNRKSFTNQEERSAFSHSKEQDSKLISHQKINPTN
jgi:hypothetical protein